MALKRKKFEYGDDIKDKEEAVKALGAAPTFNSENSILSKQALDAYMNHPEFSYDVNKDALYNQYSDKYTRQGKLAMQDTMGQAAALTGGYGNSWAQTAGQQVYQGYMQELADKVPELQQIAYGQHQDRKNDLLTKYGLYSDLEAQDYSRYRDALSDYYTRLGIAREDLANAKADAWNRYTYDEGMDYQLNRDDIADKRYEEETAYNRAWNEEERAYNRKWNEDERAYSRGQDAKADALAWAKINASEEDGDTKGVIPSLSFKDYNNIAASAYELMGEDGDSTKADNYIRRLVDSGQVSPEDANAIAAQIGMNVDYTKTDVTGWGYKDFKSYFGKLYTEGGVRMSELEAEIDEFVKDGDLSDEDAKKLKNYIFDLYGSKTHSNYVPGNRQK